MNERLQDPISMIEIVSPEQTNHYGTLFGGHALRLMDKAAFVAASRYARKTVVTACSERVDFKTAVHHGSLVELSARVESTGRTSMFVSGARLAAILCSFSRGLIGPYESRRFSRRATRIFTSG